MEETKTSIELYTKVQTVIDEINARFFEGKAGLNIYCSDCECSFEEEENEEED